MNRPVMDVPGLVPATAGWPPGRPKSSPARLWAPSPRSFDALIRRSTLRKTRCFRQFRHCWRVALSPVGIGTGDVIDQVQQLWSHVTRQSYLIPAPCPLAEMIEPAVGDRQQATSLQLVDALPAAHLERDEPGLLQHSKVAGDGRP